MRVLQVQLAACSRLSMRAAPKVVGHAEAVSCGADDARSRHRGQSIVILCKYSVANALRKTCNVLLVREAAIGCGKRQYADVLVCVFLCMSADL